MLGIEQYHMKLIEDNTSMGEICVAHLSLDVFNQKFTDLRSKLHNERDHNDLSHRKKLEISASLTKSPTSCTNSDDN